MSKQKNLNKKRKKMQKIKCNCEICEKAKEGEIEKEEIIKFLRHTKQTNQQYTIKAKPQKEKTPLYITIKQDIWISDHREKPRKIKEIWQDSTRKQKLLGLIENHKLEPIKTEDTPLKVLL